MASLIYRRGWSHREGWVVYADIEAQDVLEEQRNRTTRKLPMHLLFGALCEGDARVLWERLSGRAFLPQRSSTGNLKIVPPLMAQGSMCVHRSTQVKTK